MLAQQLVDYFEEFLVSYEFSDERTLDMSAHEQLVEDVEVPEIARENRLEF